VNAGQIYRLGELRLKNYRDDAPTAFPIDELRALVPMRRGEVFATTKLREGFDALKMRYGKFGYIDFTSTPDFDIDDDNGVINWTLMLDEEKQFMIASVAVLGLNPELERELRAATPVGQPFDYERILNFFADNKSRLPEGTGPDNLDVSRSLARGEA